MKDSKSAAGARVSTRIYQVKNSQRKPPRKRQAETMEPYKPHRIIEDITAGQNCFPTRLTELCKRPRKTVPAGSFAHLGARCASRSRCECHLEFSTMRYDEWVRVGGPPAAPSETRKERQLSGKETEVAPSRARYPQLHRAPSTFSKVRNAAHASTGCTSRKANSRWQSYRIAWIPPRSCWLPSSS